MFLHNWAPLDYPLQKLAWLLSIDSLERCMAVDKHVSVSTWTSLHLLDYLPKWHYHPWYHAAVPSYHCWPSIIRVNDPVYHVTRWLTMNIIASPEFFLMTLATRIAFSWRALSLLRAFAWYQPITFRSSCLAANSAFVKMVNRVFVSRCRFVPVEGQSRAWGSWKSNGGRKEDPSWRQVSRLHSLDQAKHHKQELLDTLLHVVREEQMHVDQLESSLESERVAGATSGRFGRSNKALFQARHKAQPSLRQIELSTLHTWRPLRWSSSAIGILPL